ncbi:thioredoxin 1 [Fistulifera solaris]|uniref:Thioredoxin 1 n=1 Tax=Fistulifera solaris TaxID=1519565 RepID=A0A1Z5JP02_FISSO|nr:thioredoxin 1 [Fistulifera solaris]|eukprot:GAX15747.1 thioredoxin 1 [Fistulifera solaris]
MAVGKTGSKVIESPDQYAEMVSTSSKTRPVLIFWTAPWCGPCRLSAPVVKEVMKQFSGDIEVAEVCTDDLPEVASDAGIVSIPTIQLWYEGKLRDTIIGCVAKSVLATAVEKVLEDTTQQKKSL